jgi:hypothetical protein
MVSVQTNLSVLSKIKEFSFQKTGQALNKNKKIDYSVKSEIFQFSSQIKADARQKIGDQNAFINFSRLNEKDKASLFYEETPISDLSVDQANALISEEGHFGIKKTSQRIIDFVIKGAGNDLDRLKAGREGVLRGFSEAGKAWGGELPEMSYKTMEKAIKALDDRIAELGGNSSEITA